MGHSKIALAVIAVLAAALSLPSLAARGGHSGGGQARASHSSGGGHAGPAHSSGGGHAGPAHFSGGGHAGPSHFSGGRHGGPRYDGGGPRHYGPRVGVYLGAPLVASAYYYGPRYYYPPAYVAHSPAVLYFCAAYNDYYPRVQYCPSGWQQVLAQPAAPGYAPPLYYPG